MITGLTVLNVHIVMVVIFMWKHGKTPSRVQVLGSGCSRVVGVEGERLQKRAETGSLEDGTCAAARECSKLSSFQSVLQPKETTKCASL